MEEIKMDIAIDLEKIRQIKKEATSRRKEEIRKEFLLKEKELKKKLEEVAKNIQAMLEEGVEKTEGKIVIVDNLSVYHFNGSLVLKEFFEALKKNGIQAYKEKYIPAGFGLHGRLRVYCYI